VVGVPERDNVVSHYRIWACNDAGCSMPRWAGAIARRLWPDANSWNFYAACSWNPVPEPLTEGIARFRFVFGCAFQNLSPIRHCDTVLYDGIAGFGGIERQVTPNTCIVPSLTSGGSWPGWPPPYVSVGQRFGPWEMAVAIRLPGA
jgi:hypothetical protein